MPIPGKLIKLSLPIVKKFSVRYHDIFKPYLLEDALTIFLYHDVSDNPSAFSRKYDLNVRPEVFDFQIQFIRNHFNLISPEELYQPQLPPRSALITFDDGLKGVFNRAVPMLEKLKIPSLIFLNMGPVKGELFWSGLITYLCSKPDFVQYLSASGVTANNIPLYLKCSQQIVEGYPKMTQSLKKEIIDFVGEFACMSDLADGSKRDLTFYGNHLYNHYVPQLMTDDAFTESYRKNDDEIKRFSNYLNMFSFPFGQPGSCFTKKHINLLSEMGAHRIFSSSALVNYNTDAYLLDRLSLSDHHNTEEKIKFQLIKHRFNNNTLFRSLRN